MARPSQQHPLHRLVPVLVVSGLARGLPSVQGASATPEADAAAPQPVTVSATAGRGRSVRNLDAGARDEPRC